MRLVTLLPAIACGGAVDAAAAAAGEHQMTAILMS
jgi:hypothetical protein